MFFFFIKQNLFWGRFVLRKPMNVIHPSIVLKNGTHKTNPPKDLPLTFLKMKLPYGFISMKPMNVTDKVKTPQGVRETPFEIELSFPVGVSFQDTLKKLVPPFRSALVIGIVYRWNANSSVVCMRFCWLINENEIIMPSIYIQSKLNVVLFTWTGFRFLSKQKLFCVEVKLSPVFQHGFLRTAENVYIHKFYGVIWKKFSPLILLLEFFWNF